MINANLLLLHFKINRFCRADHKRVSCLLCGLKLPVQFNFCPNSLEWLSWQSSHSLVIKSFPTRSQTSSSSHIEDVKAVRRKPLVQDEICNRFHGLNANLQFVIWMYEYSNEPDCVYRWQPLCHHAIKHPNWASSKRCISIRSLSLCGASNT